VSRSWGLITTIYVGRLIIETPKWPQNPRHKILDIRYFLLIISGSPKIYSKPIQTSAKPTKTYKSDSYYLFFLAIPRDSNGLLRIPKDSYELLWISMDSYGFLWISMDSYGFLGIPKDS
jgi:hypothetical protein